jgi:hypothetical protein
VKGFSSLTARRFVLFSDECAICMSNRSRKAERKYPLLPGKSTSPHAMKWTGVTAEFVMYSYFFQNGEITGEK